MEIAKAQTVILTTFSLIVQLYCKLGHIELCMFCSYFNTEH